MIPLSNLQPICITFRNGILQTIKDETSHVIHKIYQVDRVGNLMTSRPLIITFRLILIALFFLETL